MKANLGGTEMLKLLDELFNDQIKTGGQSQIFIITDGEVYERQKVIQKVEENNGFNRIFAIGLGYGADAGFLDEITSITNGKSDFVFNANELPSKVAEHIELSLKEAATGTEIHIEGNDSFEAIPYPLPPLLPQVVRHVFVSTSQAVDGVMIAGHLKDGSQVENVISLSSNLEVGEGEKSPVFALFAQMQLKRMDKEIKDDEKDDEKIEKLIKLSLESGVMCKKTSYVTVSDKSYVQPRKNESEPEIDEERISCDFEDGWKDYAPPYMEFDYCKAASPPRAAMMMEEVLRTGDEIIETEKKCRKGAMRKCREEEMEKCSVGAKRKCRGAAMRKCREGAKRKCREEEMKKCREEEMRKRREEEMRKCREEEMRKCREEEMRKYREEEMEKCREEEMRKCREEEMRKYKEKERKEEARSKSREGAEMKYYKLASSSPSSAGSHFEIKPETIKVEPAWKGDVSEVEIVRLQSRDGFWDLTSAFVTEKCSGSLTKIAGVDLSESPIVKKRVVSTVFTLAYLLKFFKENSGKWRFAKEKGLKWLKRIEASVNWEEIITNMIPSISK